MQARLIFSTAVLLVAASAPLFGGVDAGTNIFRSEIDLGSLRTTLGDPGACNTLKRLASRRPIWALYSVSATEEDADLDGAGRFVLHHFEAAHRLGLSSKLYRLTFRSTRLVDGTFAVEALPGKFIPGKLPPRSPIALRGPRHVEVLRALLHDDGSEENRGAYPTLLACLDKHVILRLQIRRREDLQFGSEVRIFDVEFLTVNRETRELSMLRFRVPYDTVAERVGAFRKLESWER